tara:strand:- start:9545 stop:9994 length:450 start_codon:yes stop_codon:yes gene_type:complete
MDHLQNNLDKMNDLLIMNYEAEKIYTEAHKIMVDGNLKAFFKERAFERKRFANELRLEIDKLGGEPKHFGKPRYNFYRTWIRLRDLVALEDEHDLLHEVRNLKLVTLEKYNELLRGINLPLSVCRLLIKQSDAIQAGLNAIKRQDLLVA